jgi:hypothetical protein
MPSGSNIQHFINDLKEGKSNIARALDELFGVNPRRHKANPAVAAVVEWLGDPDPPYKLIADARTTLLGLSLTHKELNHIDDWPDDQRRDVLAELADAIRTDNPYHFFWELTSAKREETIIDKGARKITFRSPRSKIKVAMPLSGEITIEV